MQLSISGISQFSIPLLTLSVPIAVVTLFSLPVQRRDAHLRRRGVEVSAVCEERVHNKYGRVNAINCIFLLGPGVERRAHVTAPEPAPRVGQNLRIKYDPENPGRAESTHYLDSSSSRVGLVIWQYLLGAMWVAAAVLLLI